MSARGAEPVALGSGLTTRRAPPQQGTAIGAKPVAVPPGRATPRTRYHQTFIPRPAQPGHVPAPGTPIRQPTSRAQNQAIRARLLARLIRLRRTEIKIVSIC
jgi:hypothetical protein